MVFDEPLPPDGKGRPTSAHEILGRHLRALRESRGLTLSDVARHIRASTSKVTRIELGRVGAKEGDLDGLLALYDPGAEARLALLELNRHLNDPRWWNAYGIDLPDWYCSYLVLESVAKVIMTYEVRFVPGLLQTRSYAEAVMRSAYPDEERVQRLVDVRMRRQAELLKRGSPRLVAIVEHGALIDGLADREIMREQIEFLVEATARPHVTIQVIMPHAGGHVFRSNSFSLLQLKMSEVVYLEQLDRAFFLDERRDAGPYQIGRAHV